MGDDQRPDFLTTAAVSFGAAVAFAFAVGPLVAVADALRIPGGWQVASVWRYLLGDTLVVVGQAAAISLVALPLLVVSFALWRLWPRGARVVSGAVALAAAIALIARQIGAFPLPAPARALTLLVAWGVATALFDRPHLRVAYFPLAIAYCVVLALDLPKYLTFAVLLALVVAAVHYAARGSWNTTFALESAGGSLVVAASLAAFIHLRFGGFVPALDWPFVAGLAAMALAVAAVGAAGAAALARPLPAVSVLGALSVALAAAGLIGATRPPSPTVAVSPKGPPSVVWIVWDTTRADVLEPYGAPPGSSPTLSRLAAQGVVFERAISPSPWTLPSHASMFTGLWPRSHGAWSGGQLKLRQRYVTIAELLRDAGYQTAAFSGNFNIVTPRYGFAQGFDVFYCPGRTPEHLSRPLEEFRVRLRSFDKGGENIVAAVRRWALARRDPNRPFFIFINLLEPHTPYAAPDEMVWDLPPGVSLKQARRWVPPGGGHKLIAGVAPRTRPREIGWAALRALYRGGVRYTDAITREIFDALGWGGGEAIPDNVLVIVTADHGELFGEHDRAEHQYALYEPLLHVPLVMVWKKRIPAGRRVAQPVSTADLFATVCQACGVDPKRWRGAVPARSLLALATGASASPPRRVFVTEYCPSVILRTVVKLAGVNKAPLGRFNVMLQAVYFGRWKYIRGVGQPRELLFDLIADPRELHDLSASRPDICARARRILRCWEQTVPWGGPTFADGLQVWPYPRQAP